VEGKFDANHDGQSEMERFATRLWIISQRGVAKVLPSLSAQVLASAPLRQLLFYARVQWRMLQMGTACYYNTVRRILCVNG